MRTLHLILFALALLCGPAAFAQTLLQRRIDLDVKQQRLDETLLLIAEKGGFSFSYNSALLPGDSLVSLTARGESVKQVLDKLFQRRLSYKESGTYLIFVKAPQAPPLAKTKKQPAGYTITGYVTDRSTGRQIAYASVYDTASLTSTFSDTSGFFRLTVGTPGNQAIAVSRKDYLDTVIVVQAADKPLLEVALQPAPAAADSTIAVSPVSAAVPHSSLSLMESELLNYLTSFRQRLAAMNIRSGASDRVVQFSFLPGFGTDGMMSSTINYDFSFNVLGGYTGGVRCAEIGGLFNISRGDVRYTQIAGLFNLTGGKVEGVQIAGLCNSNFGSTHGAQIAGLFNLCGDSVRGAQMAGLINVSRRRTEGAQLAGLINVTAGDVLGFQGAGLINVGDTVHAQAAGLVNVARKTNSQFAGLINVAREVKGAQVSGLINAAKSADLQFGFLNIADSSRASIGFLSFVRKGVHELELGGNDITLAHAALRTGSFAFYNVFMAGYHPVPGKRVFTFGYGIGHRFRAGKWLAVDLEANGSHVHLGAWRQFNQLYRLQVALEFRPVKRFAIFAGAAMGGNLYDTNVSPQADYAGQASAYEMLEYNYANGYRMAIGPGFQAGIRLF